MKHESGKPECVEELRRALREQHGSLLRGWRNALDRDGDLTCNFHDLCKGAAQVKFTGSVGDLFQLHADQKVLHLGDIDENIARVVEDMRSWAHCTFGSAHTLFDRFDVSGDGQLSLDEFSEACSEHGFKASQAQLTELFEGLDLDGHGLISKDEVLVLEKDPEERHAILGYLAEEKNEEKQRLIQQLHSQLKVVQTQLGPMHRLADRPWHEDVNNFPEVVRQKRAKWLKKATKEKEQSLSLFQQHLKSVYGNEVRAWRKALCPTGQNCISRKQLLAYCRHVQFEASSAALWEALDRDGEDTINIEEITPTHARVFAHFRRWGRAKAGSCTKLWATSAFKAAEQKSRSVGKIFCRNFRSAITSLGYGAVVADLRLLSSGLDLSGIGYVHFEDLLWLDTWNPPSWLLAEPDRRALHEFRMMLLDSFGTFVVAWRQVLDLDGTNRVSWREFNSACKALQFKGNIEGAWCALDEDHSGWISLKEIDRGSHDMLESFKQWANKNFGSVELAFKALDKDRSGELTFSELRKACSHLNWGGNPRQLFDAVDNPGAACQRRSIEMKELAFLDHYNEDAPTTEVQASSGGCTRKPKALIASPPTAFYCTRTVAELATMEASSNAKKRVANTGYLAKPRPWSACASNHQYRQAQDQVLVTQDSTASGHDVEHLFKRRPRSACHSSHHDRHEHRRVRGSEGQNSSIQDVERLFRRRPNSASHVRLRH
eukprot:gnl/MRDRNA2_/MRDRNA2_48488_c0_seq1.p1 gnl/MRDRNA2_/MRDRNA2_48488_c0~~gnl/MRDRNA2_/MRDRNA2_48488_c0_seq1.p1  ORF type:complete len:717 (+),score=134.76 gnl/MRDRNA2_/MRDRNA2_48488_c0_seq1:97-2247(+)